MKRDVHPGSARQQHPTKRGKPPALVRMKRLQPHWFGSALADGPPLPLQCTLEFGQQFGGVDWLGSLPLVRRIEVRDPAARDRRPVFECPVAFFGGHGLDGRSCNDTVQAVSKHDRYG